MKRWLLLILSIMLLVASLGLLFLLNTGIISFDRPYVYNFSGQLHSSVPALAFTNANLVPMEGETILTGQTLVVQDGLIADLGPSGQVAIPAGAEVIDAAGKYLLPGLVD